MNYTINQNDTLSSVAEMHGVPVNELMTYNNLTPSSILFPGMIIIIPPLHPGYPVPPVGPRPPQNRIYIVRRGDTLWSISRRFGVSVQNLMFVNGLQFPIIFPGQRLIIPTSFMPL